MAASASHSAPQHPWTDKDSDKDNSRHFRVKLDVIIDCPRKQQHASKMSDSELSNSQAPLPDASTIDATLRRIVRDANKKDEEITIRIARTRAESELGLDADFFKNDSEWKDRSKSVISAAAEEPESPGKPKPKPKPQKKPATKASAGKKRQSDETEEKPKKRARKSPIIESDDGENVEESPKPTRTKSRKTAVKKAIDLSDEGDDYEEQVQPKPKPTSKKSAASKEVVDSDEELSEEEAPPKKSSSAKPESEDESALSDPPKDTPDAENVDATEPNGKANPAADDDGDESDMSVLVDEPPAKKKRQSKSSSPKAKSKKAAAGAKKTTAAKPKATGKELSPDDEEIKRLQGWLVKCGLRKIWSKELTSCDAPKAKITHLKSMLTDAGMTGRYSAEKAKQIKEARELRAEIEAANEFNEQWGKEGDGNGDEDESEVEEKVVETKTRPGGRTLPKGLVDFGDSGDDGSD